MNAHTDTRALVLGDLMLDCHVYGGAYRASPEAPVLILDAQGEELQLGGAGAVATLLASLGIGPMVAGVVGDDPAGETVRRLASSLPLPLGEGWGEGVSPAAHASLFACRKAEATSPSRWHDKETNVQGDNGRLARGIIADLSRPTTVKRRFVSQSPARRDQQLLRVDRESRQPINGGLEDQLLSGALDALDGAKVVLISDYGKGVCTPKIVGGVIAAAFKRRLPVLVDPRRGADYSHYRFATVIKPNRHEAGEALRREIRSRAEAFAAGRELCRRWAIQAAVITLDVDGLVLVMAGGAETYFAARASQVVDVTGAGDTVLAILGAALTRGMTLEEACRLSVIGAGLQVERFGVSPVSWSEMTSVGNGLCAVPRDEGGFLPLPLGEGRGEGALPIASASHPACVEAETAAPAACPQASLDALLDQLTRHRARGQRIIFTNGCFDLLHAGHLHCLKAAKSLGDVLIVALNSDAGVRRLKGESRPIVCERDRAALVAALKCVDYVTLFDDDTPERLIGQLRPDVLVKGAESYPDGIPGEAIVRSYGGRIELIPLLPGRSTTSLTNAASVGNGLRAIPRAAVAAPL